LKQTSIGLTANTQISGDLTIVTGQTFDLLPGTYWITGGLSIQSNGVLKCSTCDNALGKGVTIILTVQANPIGTISMALGAIVNLNAPSSGPFPGLLIIQDSNGLPAGTSYASPYSSIGGAPSATLNGLIYFPKHRWHFMASPAPATRNACCSWLVRSTSMQHQVWTPEDVQKPVSPIFR
jgi:hypothetical protein